jgi:hypothetical protein
MCLQESPVATVIESLLRSPIRINAPGDCNRALGQSSGASSHACPYRKRKTADDARESVDSLIDGRSLQVDLVRLDRTVPVAGCVAS